MRTSLLVSAWAHSAGVMARSVSDIAMFNKIFSTCNSTLPSVNLSGYRIGYATNWWANLGPEVIFCPCMVPSKSISKHSRASSGKEDLLPQTLPCNALNGHYVPWHASHRSSISQGCSESRQIAYSCFAVMAVNQSWLLLTLCCRQRGHYHWGIREALSAPMARRFPSGGMWSVTH